VSKRNSDDIGIGIEKEIYSDSYFSYHYGYKKLKSHTNISLPKSKISKIENELFEVFKDVNFNLIFLNYSKRGVFVNFTLKDNITENEKKILSIKPYGNARSFTIPFKNEKLKHREIYSILKPTDLNNFNIEEESYRKIIEINQRCQARFFCLGFDVENSSPNFRDLHLEIYPRKNPDSCQQILSYLNEYNISNQKCYEKYFLDFKKFSHLKFRLLNNNVNNIKYYRSINVNIAKFYND